MLGIGLPDDWDEVESLADLETDEEDEASPCSTLNQRPAFSLSVSLAQKSEPEVAASSTAAFVDKDAALAQESPQDARVASEDVVAPCTLKPSPSFSEPLIPPEVLEALAAVAETVPAAPPTIFASSSTATTRGSIFEAAPTTSNLPVIPPAVPKVGSIFAPQTPPAKSSPEVPNPFAIFGGPVAKQEPAVNLFAVPPKSTPTAPTDTPSPLVFEAMPSGGSLFGTKAATVVPAPTPSVKAPSPDTPTDAGIPSIFSKAASPFAPPKLFASLATPAVLNNTPSSGDSQGKAEDRFTRAALKLKQVEDQLEPFKKDAQQKDYRLQVKKAINTRVGQISATWSRIQECTLSLLSLLDQYSKDAVPGRKDFAELTMALRLVDDAEVGIRAQPRAAWPVAEVACRVFDSFPIIQDLFTGLMFRSCPYLQPDYSGSKVGRKTLAASQRDGEAFTEFADRMVSYHRLWLAILVTQEDLGSIWHWFARTLNEPPCPISAPMVHAALDASGADAQKRFGKQFVKLVAYIDKEYMADLEKLQLQTKGEEADRLRASHSRLRRWLDAFKHSGRASPPEGRYVEAREESELNPNI